MATLKTRGVAFRWKGSGVSLVGDLGRLSLNDRDLLRGHRQEFEALTYWQHLLTEARASPGGVSSLFVPFISLRLEDAALVRTIHGPARIAQILPEFLRVVLEVDMKRWRIACTAAGKRLPYPCPMIRMEFSQVFPPASWQPTTDPTQERKPYNDKHLS